MSLRTPLRLLRVSAALCAIAVPARAQPSLEYNVKAALLLNFARFIEWPERAFAGPDTPIDICIVAPNPFGDTLDRVLDGETVGHRSLSARNIRNASQAVGCHLLFIPAGTEPRAVTLLNSSGPYTVTVGESSKFEETGGAVSFVVEGGRVRFTVNLRPVEERGVRISARMLNLASRVDRATQEK
jgi:hypothetical protein